MAELYIRRIPRVESVSELGMRMPTDLPRGLSMAELIKLYPIPDEQAEEKEAEKDPIKNDGV